MELDNQPVPQPVPAEGDKDLGNGSVSDQFPPSEASLDHILHGIEVTEGTAQNSGLEELKLDLCVPAQPVIEPITPVSEPEEQCVISTVTQETMNQNALNSPEAIEEGIAETGELNDLHLETPSHHVTEVVCELATNNTGSSDCSTELQSCFSMESTDTSEAPKDCVVASALIQDTQITTSNPTFSKEVGCKTNSTQDSVSKTECSVQDSPIRKNIPPKKDRFPRHKVGVSTVIPLTSSQLSLQCQECHIIFRDQRSKERHLKTNHPAEYEQCILGDCAFTCYVCDRQFTCSTELLAHQRAHTEKLPFKCPICNEAFSRSSELTSHKKVHTKQDYACVECGKPCKTLTLLKYHQRMHSGERPYICIQKNCGMRFSMRQGLQRHSERHEKIDAEGTGEKIKKRRKKGSSGQKFPCPQCDAVFRTTKTQLLHIKNKHSQDKTTEAQSSTVPVLQLKPPPIITQTVNGQPQILHMQAVEPAPQQVNVVDAEQIKRLIEKLGNVQKVNQLVILPFQPQRLGSSQPQGLFQPLHVNFTQSTAQASVCEAADADKNPLEAEQTKHQTSQEMVDLKSKETVVVSQEEKTISSSENLEIQESPVELAEEQTQTDEVHLELVPVQSETCVLPDQTPVQVEMLQNDSVSEQTHATEFQNNSDTQSIAALETKNDSPLISPTETLKSHNEAENVLLPVDIIESEETVTNTEMLCSKGTEDSTDLSVELETQVLCGEGDTVKLGEPQEIKLGEPQENQAQKDHVESENEPSMVEPKSQTNETSNSQNNISKDEQPGFVLTPDQTTANLQNCLLIQKNLPAKKKRSKKQFTDKIEEANKVSGGQIPPQKDKTASKVITKKGEKTKNKKLVVRFGPKEKKKSSKQNIIQTPKAKKKQNQQDIDKDQALILPQPDRKKGKGVESPSGGTVKSTCQINNAIDNVLASPKATQGKPQKRKIKNQNNLIKANSAQEAHQDETLVPVRKKKKQGKTSEEDGPKKSKIRKTQSDGFQKNTNKVTELKITESKCRPEAPEQPFIEQQALLLLKGHKQPQLKVHKLDATELEKSPPIKVRQNQAVIHKKEKTKSKSLKAAQQKKTASNENKISEHQGEPVSLEGSSVDNSLTSVSSVTKPKILRKRKAPTKIDQEIALSPPYSRLTLECQDCGKTFSEVSALQEHMASLHSADKVGLQDGFRVMAPGANEKHIQPNTFEIQVATDWDMETEVGEILGDREEHRLSFPALSPSPSLTVAPGCVEEKEQEGNKDIERSVPRLEQPPDKTPTEVCQTPTQVPVSALDKSIVPQEITGNIACDKELEKDLSKDVEPITEMSHSDLKDTVEGEIKEELPLEVNLVTVEDQNEEGNHSPQTNVSSVTKECENGVNFNAYSQPQQSAKDTNVELDQNVVHSSTETEIKQEEEEVLVHRVDDQKRVKNPATRGKKGAGRGRGKKPLGRRTSTENRSKKDMETKKDSQECQVVYQLCVLNDTREAKDKEMDKSEPNASESCLPATPEETHEEQVVFELDSVTTSVIEVVNSEDGSFSEKSRELVRDGSSPGIILEKFLTARERDPNGQSHMRQGDLDTSKVTLDYTSADVKIEERPSIQALNSLIPSEGGLMRGVQMFLVKAEDHLTLNEPVIFQAHQPMDTHRTECQDKTIDKNRDCISSDSHVVPLQSYSKQCIFYPVKEEEREHLVELSVEDQRCLNSGGFAGASSGIEECEEIRVGSEQMEMQHIYSNTEEGDTGGEQQSTQGILEFLSQSSDTDDSDNVHSEPEAETIVMSCYHGIQSNSTVRQNGMQRCSTSGGQNFDPLLTGHTEAERQLTWKPIKYFSQYFSWNTWKEISACTRGISKLPNPVTDKEVAQFVGIHIAMGTLKFPSSTLYWEDFTRVPLISDAMSASRFCELAQELRLASFGGASMETSSDQQSEKKNGGQTEPGSLTSKNTSRVFSQSHSIEKAYNCTNFLRSKTDPLWKVMTLIKKVQEGCRTLKGNGNFGVDQYPLPFQRHPTHSLLHTVVISSGGLVVDFSLSVDDSNRENVVENMVSTGKDRNDGMVFLCKPELSTPSMVEHLLEAGVQSAGKVGGARGQIGDEFVSSDGKLKLFRCHHGFILSATVKEKSRSTSLVSGFERAIKSANLNRDLRSLYRTPCTNTAVSAWPQSVLWDLIDLVLVNAWLQYKQDYSDATDLLSLMSFRLEVAKALILSSGVDAQDSLPPCPPAPKLNSDTNSGPSQVLETPLPDEVTRYDGFGHWPEQLAEGEEARCRFGGCERTSRVRCLKCCVFLCISQNHNCFLKFHSQGAS